jgi:hypothetical protein
MTIWPPPCFSVYSNSSSSFSAAVLSELFKKWLYMSVVVLVREWPARPATVTSGTPAAICDDTLAALGLGILFYEADAFCRCD